jgi:hypothetical protein
MVVGWSRFYSDGLFQRMETWWLSDDEVVLDPTRLTLFVGNAGIEGERCRRFPARETHCFCAPRFSTTLAGYAAVKLGSPISMHSAQLRGPV